MDDYHEVGLPIRIGATQFDTGRIQGPPSKLLPALRDAATGTLKLSEQLGGETKPRVTVEVDTAQSRRMGTIHCLSSGHQRDETLHLRFAHERHQFKLKDILAFRVLKVEIEVKEENSK